jgi:hypothetical protein
MRTPGRCTNFETCWLANGRRDIRVLVGDAFVCPACGEALHAPSIESISANGIVGALAISLAMVATAGGAGYGVVRIAQTTGRTNTNIAALHAPAQQPQIAAAVAATTPKIAAAPLSETALGQAQIRNNPVEQRQLIELAASVPALRVDPSVPAVVFVAAAPPHALVLPINFGRPHAPEDDAPAESARWHRHAFGAGHRGYSTPAPVWSADDEQTQDSAPGSDATPDQAAASPAVPDQTASADAAQTDAGQSMPAEQSDAVAPAATHVAYVQDADAAAPSRFSHLIEPAVATGERVPAYQPAARIDPSEAAQIDRAPDASYRLATLPAAQPGELAVPAYPPQQEASDQPGRVDVDCVISERGMPSGCEVQRQEGGHSFARSVMSWLKSGSVRYRPSVVAGQPAAEPRNYQVRFEPE